MRRRHARARDGVGRRAGADPGGQDVAAGGEDVDQGAEVGVAGAVVVDVGGADGADGGGGGGGGETGVAAVVARRDGDEDAGVDRGL